MSRVHTYITYFYQPGLNLFSTLRNFLHLFTFFARHSPQLSNQGRVICSSFFIPLNITKNLSIALSHLKSLVSFATNTFAKMQCNNIHRRIICRKTRLCRFTDNSTLHYSVKRFCAIVSVY